MPVSDRLLIRNLFKKHAKPEKNGEYLDRKLYLNAGYTGIISSHDLIETNITQLAHEYECECGQVHESAPKPGKGSGKEEDQATLTQNWVQRAKLKIFDKHLSAHYVFIDAGQDIDDEKKSQSAIKV